MAKERITRTLQISGKLANVVYFRRMGETISRTLVIPFNPKFRQQMLNRISLVNLVFNYRALKPAIVGAFETKETRESDYNAFIRRNKVGYGPSSSLFPVTKTASQNGEGYPDEVVISEGSLPTLQYSFDADSVDTGKFGLAAGTYADVSVAWKKYLDGIYGADAPRIGIVKIEAWADRTPGHIYSRASRISYNATVAELTAAGLSVTGTAPNQVLNFHTGTEASGSEIATMGFYASMLTADKKILTSTQRMAGNAGYSSNYSRIAEENLWQKALDTYGYNEAPLSRQAAEPSDI